MAGLTEEELIALVTDFRKETEDLINAQVQDLFNIQYGEANLEEGTISIAIPTAYLSVNDYEIVVFSALDLDGTDIKESLGITKVSASGFSVLSSRVGVLRWETVRRVPKINFWTE